MNILIIAKEDFSGAGYAQMQAINSCTEHECRAITYRMMGLRYPVDILRPTPEELAHWVDWADVLNLHDAHPPDFRGLKKRPQRPVVTTYHGSWYRAPVHRRRHTDATCKQKGWIQTALVIELATYGPRWIGRAIPDLSHMWEPDADIFRVSQAATNRLRKGVNETLAALKRIEGIKFEIIEKVNNAECLRRKSHSHLSIDMGPAPGMLSHGTTSLESWSMGMPVISCPQEWIHNAALEYIGYSPYCYCTNQEELREAVVRFRDDEKFYKHWQEIGQRYIAEFHAPAVVAEKFVAACEEAMQ